MSKSADAFRTISEVAEWLGVQTHVLRFWESKFTHVKPVKRAGGRRYYRPADMLLLGGIRRLLHDDGLTIKGVQKILREEGVAHVADLSHPLDDDISAQLDADLADTTGADVAEAVPSGPDTSRLDQAPEHSRPQSPTPPADEAEMEGETKAPLPSFMRGEEPDPEPEAAPTPREPDVPTLTPEMDVFEDAPAQAEAPSVAPEDTPAPVPMVEDDAPAPEPMAQEDAPAPEPFVPDALDDAPASEPFVPDAPPPPEPIAAETSHEQLFEEISLTPTDAPEAPEAPEPPETPEPQDPAPVEAEQQPPAFEFDAPEEEKAKAPVSFEFDAKEEAARELEFEFDQDALDAVDDDTPAVLITGEDNEPIVPLVEAAPVEPQADPIPDAPEAPTPAVEPEAPEATPEAPAGEPMPMFKRAAPPAPVPEPSVEAAAPASAEPEPTPEPEPAAAPRPRIIDVPDDEEFDSADFAPSVLTKAAKLRTLTPQQREQVRPLVAQLTALRDKMTQARQDTQ